MGEVGGMGGLGLVGGVVEVGLVGGVGEEVVVVGVEGVRVFCTAPLLLLSAAKSISHDKGRRGEEEKRGRARRGRAE